MTLQIKRHDSETGTGTIRLTDLPGAKDLWMQTLKMTRSGIPSATFDKWLAGARFAAEIDKAIVIAVPDQLALDRIMVDYARPLQRTWQELDPKGRRLKFELWWHLPADIRSMVSNPWGAGDIPAEPDSPATEDDKSGCVVETMTFDTLVIGPSNARAAGLARRLAENTPIPSGIIVIYGQPGTGKTHILKAIKAETAKRGDTRRLVYISAEEFMTRFVEGARTGDTRQLQAFVKNSDLLMIDDLHWIAGKAKTDRAFFGALRAVTSMGGHVIITADAAPGDMVGLSKELVSEIKGAASVEINTPDDDMRKAIVRCHAKLITDMTPNFIVDETMVERIVSAIRGPGRELCGVLWSLQLETGYGEFAPTPSMLETVIRRIAGEPRTPSLDDIKRTCVDLFSISKADIESVSKARNICRPRQIAMYLSRVMTDKSYPQIAAAYKKKDHTTVLHAYRKITAAMNKPDHDMAAEIERVRQAVIDRVMSGTGTVH